MRLCLLRTSLWEWVSDNLARGWVFHVSRRLCLVTLRVDTDAQASSVSSFSRQHESVVTNKQLEGVEAAEGDHTLRRRTSPLRRVENMRVENMRVRTRNCATTASYLQCVRPGPSLMMPTLRHCLPQRSATSDVGLTHGQLSSA